MATLRCVRSRFPCGRRVEHACAVQVNVEQYISKLIEVPTGVKTLNDIIEFNKTHADKELIEPFWADQVTSVVGFS